MTIRGGAVGRALLLLGTLAVLPGCFGFDGDDDDGGGSAPVALRGPRGLDACPALVPLNPPPLPSDAAAARCRAGVATAGRSYAGTVLRAETSCLDRVVRGELDGDPTDLCRGLRFLSTGEIRLPEDEATAQAIEEAENAMAALLEAECSPPAVAALDLCAESVAGLADCLIADHWEHAQHVLDQVYGQAEPVAYPTAGQCQAALGGASARFLESAADAIAGCLTGPDAAGRRDGARFCVGEARDGGIVAPRDGTTSDRLRSAATTLALEIASRCDEAAIDRLDTCADGVLASISCLRCTLQREAMLLVGAWFGGEANRAATRFIDWSRLRNPVLGLDDRRIKDQTVGRQDGWFHLYASQSFADDDPEAETKEIVAFRTRDFLGYETFPERIRPAGGGVGSPDLTFLDDRWQVVFQDPDPEIPENRRLFLATSEDLMSWSAPLELVPGVFPGESIIDGSLAKRGGFYWVVFKLRVPQEPYFTRSSGPVLDQSWLAPKRLILQEEDVIAGLGEGFGENFQLVEIDGRIRLIATARDPEGFRCNNIYTCSHEPFVYTLAEGDGSEVEDWRVWDHKTQLRIPYEDWNSVMHANTGYLNDWRAQDGFFYLTYSGSLDSESFQMRGHDEIGIARSRDLIHWRVAGDLRD